MSYLDNHEFAERVDGRELVLELLVKYQKAIQSPAL
jgi:hypothetical protein